MRCQVPAGVNITDTKVLKQPSLLWSQTDVTAAGESGRSKTSSSGFKESWKISALGQWYLGNSQRGELWVSIFLSLPLFSKRFKLSQLCLLLYADTRHLNPHLKGVYLPGSGIGNKYLAFSINICQREERRKNGRENWLEGKTYM